MAVFGRARIPAADPAPPSADTNADRLTMHMLAAVAKVDAVLGGWSRTRNATDVVNGLLEIRHRLTEGLPKS